MIWYDAETHKAIAPGEGEDGGPPSFDSYYCRRCKANRRLIPKMRAMICEVCHLVLLYS